MSRAFECAYAAVCIGFGKLVGCAGGEGLGHWLRSASLAVLLGLLASAAPVAIGSTVLAAQDTGTWSPTGSMATARADDVAVTLQTGDVLVAGGGSCNTALASAEIYHASGPAVGTWTSAGSMSEGRYNATATLLGDGKVLVAGGNNNACMPTTSADLYDPVRNAWTPTGAMQFARSAHTATLTRAPNVVVVAGGFGNQGVAHTTERYDENLGGGTWTRGSDLNVGRWEHTAVFRPVTNEVILIGGNTGTGITTSTEVNYRAESATSAWGLGPDMNGSRYDFTATVLSSGFVLVAGGDSNSGFVQATSELGIPWTQVSNMASPRNRHTATLLSSGQVLVAGGNITYSLSSAELFTPVPDPLGKGAPPTGFWTSAGTMGTPRSDAVAARLPNGGVPVAGGVPGIFSGPLASAEVYTPRQTQNPVPMLVSLSANQAPVGVSTPLSVSGTGFTTNSTILLDGVFAPTTFVDAQTLTTAVQRATSRVLWISVQSPVPGGGTSVNSLPFYVTPSGVGLDSAASGLSINGNASAIVPAPAGVVPPTPGTAGTVSVTGSGGSSGSASVAVALYTGNAGSVTTFDSSGAYFDVTLGTAGFFPDMTIVDCNLNGGNAIYWFDGTAWKPASNQSPTPTGCVTITINSTTSPFASELHGTVFAAGRPPTLTFSLTTADGHTYVPGSWTQQNVQVNVTCAPVGLSIGSAPQTVTSQGKDQSVSGTCADNAGASTQATVSGIDIDKTAPVTTATLVPGPPRAGVPPLNVRATSTISDSAGRVVGIIPFTCFDTAGLTLALTATDTGGSGVAGITYAAAHAQTIGSTTVANDTTQFSITKPGWMQVNFAATDRAGNVEAEEHETVLVTREFSCAGPTPSFSSPAHGTISLSGSATINGRSIPINWVIAY